MIQTLFALLIISLFIIRLIWQKQKGQVASSEFLFWLSFWMISGILILFIKDIDLIVAKLGFSGSGIQILLYLAVALLFSQIFRLRLKIEKMDQNITRLTEHQAKKTFNEKK